jgi:hypothetical protein
MRTRGGNLHRSFFLPLPFFFHIWSWFYLLLLPLSSWGFLARWFPSPHRLVWSDRSCCARSRFPHCKLSISPLQCRCCASHTCAHCFFPVLCLPGCALGLVSLPHHVLLWGEGGGIFASLSYFSLRLRAPIGVSPTHRIFFWGEGGGHLCLRQLMLAKVFSTRSHCFITGIAVEFITYVWSCGIWIN